ncbi:hypothetical protein D3C81_1989000 [compost metagenome]
MQALLIGAQPQVFEVECIDGLRQREQQRQAEQPATATRACREQQQRKQQPVTLIRPSVEAQRLAIVSQGARTVEQAEGAQVAITQARVAIASIQVVDKGLQSRLVQT